MIYLLSLLAGVLIGLPFKFPWLAWLAWGGLIPFLFIFPTRTNKQGFLSGWLLGAAFFSISGYWLLYPVLDFSGYPWPVAVGLVLFAVALLSLYFGAAGLITNFILKQLNWPIFIVFPVVWTGLEVIRTFFSFEFQFGFLGYSQSAFPVLIQLASYGGVYLISFLIVLVNALLYQIFKSSSRQKKIFFSISVVVIIGFIFSFGQARMNSTVGSPGREFEFTAVQPNIPQEIKMDSSKNDYIAERLKKLSHQGIKDSPPDLLIWPETAVLRIYNLDKEFPYQVDPSVPLLVGGFLREENDLLNSALLVNENGKIIDHYSKNRLVPWGEYVPFSGLMPDFISDDLSDITPGTKLESFKFQEVEWITPICSEILNPFYILDLYNNSDLIITISNEAWFEETNLPWQMYQAAIFRAVETNTPVIKSGNTGFSGVINRRGEILVKTELFTSDVFSFSINLPSQPEGTWYSKWGNVFGWGIVGLFFCLLAVSLYHLKKD